MSALLRLRKPMRQHGLWKVWLVAWRARSRAVRFSWSLHNWRRGLKFDPVGRHRCCDHTTPLHTVWCDNRPLTEASTGGES